MRYKHWELLYEMPEGWKVDKTVGSPMYGAVFITNGKSVVSGQQKRALLRLVKKNESGKVVCGSCECELDYNNLHAGICDECGFQLAR